MPNIIKPIVQHFPFKKSLEAHGRDSRLVFVKWAIPAAVNAMCLFLSMWLLHIATYYYVHEMHRWGKNYEVLPDPGAGSVPMSYGRNFSDVSFGSLNDVVEEGLGYTLLSTAVLDKIAAVFPFFFMVLVILTDDLRTWVKVMTCNAMLALIKGLLGAMTTVPDSAGWAACKARLGKDGLEWMEQVHTPLDLLWHELFGVHGHHLRWCADMMYSGHTYFTTLYALGLYEVVRILTRNVDGAGRVIALSSVALLAVLEQLVEVWCVLRSHFHYSMDVFLAIMVTFLFYTNGGVAVFAKWWAVVLSDAMRPKQQPTITVQQLREVVARDALAKDLVVGAATGMQQLYNNLFAANEIAIFDNGNMDNLRKAHLKLEMAIEESKRTSEELQVTKRNFKALEETVAERMRGRGGDVLVPICCFPFCCLAGRQHIMSDSMVSDILETMELSKEAIQRIMQDLQVGEGVGFQELVTAEMARQRSKVAGEWDCIPWLQKTQDMFRRLRYGGGGSRPIQRPPQQHVLQHGLLEEDHYP